MKLKVLVLGFCLTLCQSVHAAPLGMAFNYQGYLTEGGSPANGTFDFYVELFDAPTGTNFLGAREVEDVDVSNGRTKRWGRALPTPPGAP